MGSLLGAVVIGMVRPVAGFCVPLSRLIEDAVDHLGIRDEGNDAHGLPALDMMLSKQLYEVTLNCCIVPATAVSLCNNYAYENHRKENSSLGARGVGGGYRMRLPAYRPAGRRGRV